MSHKRRNIYDSFHPLLIPVVIGTG